LTPSTSLPPLPPFTSSTSSTSSTSLNRCPPVLQIIKDSQQQHGLRHGDYQRYRGYCSRRLRRLRKTLGFKMGNRYKYSGKKVTVEMVRDNRYLLLVVMEAERAWSYAMQLKQEANTEPRKRFHLMARLRKAAKHGEQLERLCESPRVDAKTKLEAQAYTAYLTGMVQFELQEWKAAMEAFNKCKTIYEKLASAFTEEQAVLYHQRVEEISPNIRYCAYNIGDQNAINDLMQMRLSAGGGGGMMAEKLEALITQTRAKQAATMSEVEWRGRTVPVKIDKARIFLLGLADNEAAIVQAANEETKERLYETLLADCRDTIQAVREELRTDVKQRAGDSAESGKVSNLQYLHSYLTYIKLWTVVRRNESMAHALQAKLKEPQTDENKRGPRPQDLIRLYDIILQSLAELSTLQGLEEDHTFQKEVALKTLIYKAYRCFFIAQSYVLVKKWSEALVLYERVLKYAREVQSKAKNLNNSLKDLPDVQELIAEVNAEKYSLQAAAILGGSLSMWPFRFCSTLIKSFFKSSLLYKNGPPLSERLDTFRLDPSLLGKQPNLVQFPPDFQPIPCKPLFFDLALNHVAFPPLDDKVEQKGKGGLTGYIKGIFGFGS
uniref:Signal recognition particle subunit SRP68 n=1 Tax=Pygocentrus nattereri TaxID=42514 RepID=A0A3B4DEX2_PYGNA